MNIAVVTFTNDMASMNEREFLVPSFEKTDLVFDGYDVLILNENNDVILLQTDKESVLYENLDKEIESQIRIKPDLIIFATKHQSSSGIHSLSVHTQGNWTKADYGGKEREVCICPVRFLNDAYIKLKEKNEKIGAGYEVILECTHHGPFIETPSAFIEIGSDEESWKRKDAGKVIAETLMEILSDFSFELEKDLPVAMGIGGLHHCPQFTKRIERKEAHISHVIPKYIEGVTKESIEKAIERSIPKINLFILDWKGLGKDKTNMLSIVEKISKEKEIEIKRNTYFK